MRPLALAAAAAAALALPVAAQAAPNAFTLSTKLAPGGTASLTLGSFPKGEFAFRLRLSSDGDKRFTLTQQRNGGTRFTVLAVPGPAVASACQGAAGSLFCSGITTPVTPAGRTWTLRMRNRSNRPMSVTLRVRFRPVPNAG